MTHLVATPNLTDSTTFQIREVLAGQRGGLRSALLFAGPAVIASIAYVDQAISPPIFRRAPAMAMPCCGWWFWPI